MINIVINIIKYCLGEPGGTVMLGFDPLVNQRLLPPTFPRYTRIKSRAEAYEYIDELLSRLKQACKVTTCTSFHTALVCNIYRFIINFYISI